MSRLNLLDILKANGADAMVGLVDETIKAHPELELGSARTIKGMQYKTLVRTALGNVASPGSFRDANAGASTHKHTYENRLVETFILEARSEVDKAVADSSEDGAQAVIAREQSGTLEGELQGVCRVFYYGRGTGGNAKGFPGLINSHDAANMVVDAGGTTADTGSSVWAVRFGPKDIQWVWGMNGQLAFSPVRVETLVDAADSTKKFDGYVSVLLGRPGLQVASIESVGRIKKLTADAGKGLTDALISQLLAKFPVGKGPDVLLMNRRSHQQLQASRTATSPTGAPAPFPDNAFGTPIRVTDSILSTESLAL